MEENIDLEELLKIIRTKGLTEKSTTKVNPNVNYFKLPESGLYVYIGTDGRDIIITMKKLSTKEIEDVGWYPVTKDSCMIKAKFRSEESIMFHYGTNFTDEKLEKETTVYAGVECEQNRITIWQNQAGAGKGRYSVLWNNHVDYTLSENKSVITAIEDAITHNSKYTDMERTMLIDRFRELQNALVKEWRVQKLSKSSEEQCSGVTGMAVGRVARGLIEGGDLNRLCNQAGCEMQQD